MNLIETLNRTMKLAMDEGVVGSYEEARCLFGSFRLRVVVQAGFTAVPAAEAAVLTLLNAAPRTFLGGVELAGPLEERCTQAWFANMKLGEIAQQFGVVTSASALDDVPTIYVGGGHQQLNVFSLGITFKRDGFVLSPDHADMGAVICPVEAGVAAAGAALNEAFQHSYRKAPLAGHRNIPWEMPPISRASPISSLWIIGLGHLGQAFLWTAALAGRELLPRHIRLSDYDTVSWSSLSTGLLVKAQDVGQKKVDVVAEHLELLGVHVQRDYNQLSLDAGVVQSAHDLAVVAVDNIALRRSLDRLDAKRVLEGGIGDGADAFTRIQLHAFPGPRKARDIWLGDDVRAVRAVDISKPAYQALLDKSGDECGTTLIAGRSVATPFIGAFAGATLCMLAKDSLSPDYAWSYDVCNL